MKLLPCFLIAFLFQLNLLAWGANGHRIVAAICDMHLTAETKMEMEELLGKYYIEEITNWPDYIKAEDNWDFAQPWHYTTVHPDQTIDQVRQRYRQDSTINDAFEAIQLMKDVLTGDVEATEYFEHLITSHRARKLNNSTKATALAFLVHIVGDIHQPMHVGKNRDLGGNKISVQFFGKQTNVHAVWDTEIIEHERLSYSEFARFINKASPDEIDAYQDTGVNEWAQESIEYRERIYNTLYDYTDRDSGLPSFSWDYQHDNIVVVKKRLLQGGIRLAGLLNEILG